MGLTVRMLGGFAVLGAEDDVVRIPTRKAQALLALLARRSGEPQSREALAAMLWPDSRETQARGNLRQTLKLLRRALLDAKPVAIISEGDALKLRAEAAEVDVVSFERLCQKGTSNAIERAVDLYRGDLLAGFVCPTEPFAEWISYDRTDLRERAVNALSRLVAFHEHERHWEPAIRTAIRLLAFDPLQEHVHRLLMRLYLNQGRRGAAVDQYEKCRAVLEHDLGVEPEPETVRLYQEIRRPAAARGAGPGIYEGHARRRRHCGCSLDGRGS